MLSGVPDVALSIIPSVYFKDGVTLQLVRFQAQPLFAVEVFISSKSRKFTQYWKARWLSDCHLGLGSYVALWKLHLLLTGLYQPYS